MDEFDRDARPSRDRSTPRLLVMVGLLLASFGMVALGGVLLIRSWKPKTAKVRMLTDLALNQALLGRRITAQARRHGLEVELSPRAAGALEALDLVDRGDSIDVALVAGGVSRRDYPEVRQATALAPVLLHLLARAEIAEGGLVRLRGRRVNLGPPKTATNASARDILAFAGLRSPSEGSTGDFEALELSSAEIERKLARLQAAAGDERARALAELPDAFFNLTPMPSILAKDLVAAAGYRLVPLPFAEAYCLDRLGQPLADQIHVDRSSFSSADIPAYTYGIDPPVPSTPCRTVATRLILIAHATVSADAISRLMETVHDGQIARVAEPVMPRDQSPQFPFHAGTEQYMRRNEPLLTPDLAASLGKLAGGVGALASGLVAFYSFLRLRQLRRFEAYYHAIRRVELIARGQEVDPDAPDDRQALHDYLEDQLLDLKSQALKDFAEGGLKGEGLMSGIVSLVNDTRASLARLAGDSGPGREAVVG